MNNKNLSDEDFVKTLYNLFMDREGEATGIALSLIHISRVRLPRPLHTGPPRRQRMIYLVEDDDEIRTLEEYALKSAGFSVRGFSDGAPFKQALEQERPSLVILDVMLPGEDGIALLRHVRAQCGTALPVMMVTAKSAELDVVAGLEGGADDYLDVYKRQAW